MLAAFLGLGLVVGFWPVTDWAYGAQIARGLTPGGPIGSEPGSISFLFLALVLLLSGGLLGMTLGAALLCICLALLTPLSLRDAFRAVFLSYFPPHWFREQSAA